MLTRRTFLVNGMRVTAVAPLLSFRDPGRSRAPVERVLVVLQLSGGNDWLNTVVPHRQDLYFRLRPNLSLERGALHRLDEDHGLHPELGGLARLFAEGRVAIVNGVGYPSPDRSHFHSMEIWHTGDPEGSGARPDTGWMGRLADQIVATEPGLLAALHVGTGSLPLALRGRTAFAPTVRDGSGFELREPAGFAAPRNELLRAGRSDGELAFLRSAAAATYGAVERMRAAAESGGGGDYPDSDLARRLRLVARLVAGGFGTRLFHVELGGFDTHARQAPVHAALLSQLSQALTAFQADLAARGVGDRVVTLVFSEFGRRAAENGSKGTDHGAAAPVLLVGDPVRGGLHGVPPDLSRLEDGDLVFSTDFRSVYATLERDWMGLVPSSRRDGLALLA